MMAHINRTPQFNIIEKTAIELAIAVYDQYRRDGNYDPRYKNEKIYAQKNLEKHIPKAVELLTSMLSRPDLNDILKHQIYEALLERANWVPTVNGKPIDDKILH